jgi:fermentation-respiration switch protein FrsA (DUF1100 family)
MIDRPKLPLHRADHLSICQRSKILFSACGLALEVRHASAMPQAAKETTAMRVGCLLVLVLGLLTGCQSLENRLVFHPTPADPEDSATHWELHTADGVKIRARWLPYPQAQGVLLYCYGNAGNLEQRSELARTFASSLERSVLTFDYPGYGGSEGQPSEAGCYSAAQAAYEWLLREQRVPPERIVICGESLGGGVAVELASKRPHEALVLIRTFTSIPDVAKEHLMVSSAASLMVNRFDNLKKLPSCRAPIFLAQGDKDRLVPFAQGEQLRNACKAPVHFQRLRGLDHNDPLPADFFRDLREFLDQNGNGRKMPLL